MNKIFTILYWTMMKMSHLFIVQMMSLAKRSERMFS